MYIRLKNVGCINEAKVDLTGLNVIAGENGTGKSTVGKTVYAIIESICYCDGIVNKKRENLVKNVCPSVFFSIQSNLIRQKSANNDVKAFMDNFNMSLAHTLLEFLHNEEYDKARELIDNNINLLDKFDNLNEKGKLSVKKSLEDLKNIFNNINEDDAIKQSLEFIYWEMFRQQVNNLKSHDTSEIVFDNNGYRLEYHVSNNADALEFSDRLRVDKIDSNLKQSIFPKVTFIESSLILQIADVNDLPFYWKDFIEKLKRETRTTELGFCKQIYDDLSNVLGGELVYDTDKQGFNFIKKGTDNKLFVNNMASGKKTLGFLQKMAKMGLLSPDHLLIFDEPENHLHPRWQVKLAEILITLVENNVSILLATHSATLIDALQEFAESKEISDKVKFYFADKRDMTIKNVDDIDNNGKDIIFESFYNAKDLLPEFPNNA
jgi:predicted ATP-dependent endonuclease of OLD family